MAAVTITLPAEPTPVKTEPAPVEAEPEPIKPTPQPTKIVPVVPAPAPKSNPTIDLIAASQKELQEATLTLMGAKATNMPDQTLNTTPEISTQVVTAPLTPPEIVKTVVPTVKTPPPVQPILGLIKITGTDINKFPETEQFHEMRLLTITLTATELREALDPEAVSVKVIFMDRDRNTGRIGPASPPGTPAASLTVQGKWRASEQKTVTASYVVPATPVQTERTTQYYGFVIRVYYYGTLQDELSQPKDLPRGLDSAASNEAAPAP